MTPELNSALVQFLTTATVAVFIWIMTMLGGLLLAVIAMFSNTRK